MSNKQLHTKFVKLQSKQKTLDDIFVDETFIKNASNQENAHLAQFGAKVCTPH